MPCFPVMLDDMCFCFTAAEYMFKATACVTYDAMYAYAIPQSPDAITLSFVWSPIYKFYILQQ